MIEIYFKWKFYDLFQLQASISKKPSRDGRDDRNRDKRQMMPPPKVIDLNIEKVELHQTENAWKPAKLSDNTIVESQVRILMLKDTFIWNHQLRIIETYFIFCHTSFFANYF